MEEAASRAQINKQLKLKILCLDLIIGSTN